MLCDMCGYNGEVDKNDPKYLMMFDLKMKDQIPEQYVNSLRDFQFCSKCRKILLGFIDTKRVENDLNPIMEYNQIAFLDTWLSMSADKKQYIHASVYDAKINGSMSSPSGKANLKPLYTKVKDSWTDDDNLLLGYCRNKQDLPWSIKTYEKEKNQNAKESS